MSLFDTLDGTFMNFAYQWAFSNPVRKVFYNLAITGLSIAVAFFIGTIELVGVLHDKLDLHGRRSPAGSPASTSTTSATSSSACSWWCGPRRSPTGGSRRSSSAGRYGPPTPLAGRCRSSTAR